MSLVLEVQTANEWHVLKGDTQFGPYTYSEMIQMLQNKVIYGFDYAWSPHLEGWTNLSDLPEFSEDRLHRIVEKSKGSEVFQQRKHERAQCSKQVYIHDDQKFWSGELQSLSQGGGSILMDNPLLLPGDIVTIHFRKQNAEDTAFNARVEILTKKMIKQKIQHDSKIQYAVKFIETTEAGDKQVQSWIQKSKENNK
ncbi:MAG: hypothetical protein BroJett040_23310 [Oligoflexia bacterium]|nr:MAG: hypothetical protein BroJett040_23310 [Oligoflexia bacterium]